MASCCRGGGIVLLVALAGAAGAQAPSPGDVLEQLPRAPAPAAPGQAPAVEEAPSGTQPPVPAGGPQIPVRRFAIEGNTAIPDAELQAAVSQFRGKRLTLLQIYGVADLLTRYYRDHGYTLATVTVPPQKIEQGTVRLEVIEGRVGRLGFEGNRSYSDGFLSRWLTGLEPGGVVHGGALTRGMLLLNDLPGLRTTAVVKPGAGYGTSDIVVRSEEKRTEGELRLNNYGRESVGQFRVEADLYLNNATGRGDRLGASLIHSQGNLLDYGRLDYSVPVNARGTRAALSLSRFVFNVDTGSLGGAFAGTELSGDGTSARAELSHPLLRSRRRNLFVGLALSHTETAQSGDLVVPGSGSQFLNLVELSARWSLIHSSGAITSVAGLASSNFKTNPDGTRNNAQRAKFRVDVSHLRGLGPGWSLFARATGVLSLDPLLDIERFRIGGPGSVRGFPSAELAGDDGFMGTLQLNRQLPTLASVPAVLRVFWDGGVVHRKDDARAVSGEPVRESLTSIGVGLTATIAQRFRVDVEAARPLSGRAVSDGRGGGRLWAQVSARF